MRRPAGALDLIASFIAVAWGLWLLAPWWDVFGVSASYDVFALLPEPAWGWAAFLIGVAQLAGIFWRHHRLRRFSAVAAVGFWCFVTTAFVLGNFRSTATVIYPFVVIANIIAFVKLNPANNGKIDG